MLEQLARALAQHGEHVAGRHVRWHDERDILGRGREGRDRGRRDLGGTRLDERIEIQLEYGDHARQVELHGQRWQQLPREADPSVTDP